MKKMSFLVVFLFISKIVHAQDITQGIWMSEEKDSKIQFYKQGDKFYGKFVWLIDDRPNKLALDDKNPNEKLRSQPLLNMVFLKHFSYNGKNSWEDGEIYDPRNGKTYSCKMTLANPKQLDVRGYIGISLLGRTTHFTRIN